MSKETKNTQMAEQLHTDISAQKEANNNPSTLVERNPIINTPFHTVKENEKWFIVIGRYKLTDAVDTEEEALKELETKKWLILVNTICAINHADLERNLRENEVTKKTKTDNEKKGLI